MSQWDGAERREKCGLHDLMVEHYKDIFGNVVTEIKDLKEQVCSLRKAFMPKLTIIILISIVGGIISVMWYRQEKIIDRMIENQIDMKINQSQMTNNQSSMDRKLEEIRKEIKNLN